CWLAVAASIAAILWGLLLTTTAALGPIEGAVYALALFVLAAFFLVVDVQRHQGEAATSDGAVLRFPFDPLASLVLAGLAALAVCINAATGFDPAGVAAELAIGAGLLAIAYRHDAVATAAPIAA